jgi:WXG100 family type VII secretion target
MEIGGDIEQLSSLEQTFTREAGNVTQLRSAISATLNGTSWRGPAAQRFREKWNGEFSQTLARLCDALTQNAQYVRDTHAAYQQIGG